MSLAQTQSLYRRTLKEVVYVRRYTGTGTNRPPFDTLAHAQVKGVLPSEGARDDLRRRDHFATPDYKVVLLVEDLIDAGFALPLTVNDKLIYKGRELTILSLDDATRSVDGELVAYDFMARG